MKRFVIVILIVHLLLFGQFAKVGISGVKFLNVGIGTRSMGMSQAFTAVGDNAEAIYWNPAGIVKAPGTTIFGDKLWLWDGIGINSIAITQTIGFAGVIGFFYSGLTSGEWEEVTVEEPLGTGIYVDYKAFQAGVSYARFLTDRFSFGLNLKLISEDYPDLPRNSHDVLGFAMDVGGYYITGFRDLTIGLSIQHFGPDVTPSGTYTDYDDGQVTKIDEEFVAYPLPIMFRGGLAMTVFDMEQLKVLLAVDLIHPSDNIERYAFGTEISILEILKFRTGYQLGGGVDEGVGAFNFGFGVVQQTTLRGFEFGYSYTDGYYLPAVHRVSFTLGL